MQQTPEDPESPTTHSITTERMMAKKVEPDTFRPPCHKLRKDIETKLVELLKEYQSQFAHDETTIGTTPLNPNDDRYQSFCASLTETLSDSDETLQMG